MQTIKLKPAQADLLVRLEDGSGYLPAQGATVPHTAYYRRRLMDGDVVNITTEAKKGGSKNA